MEGELAERLDRPAEHLEHRARRERRGLRGVRQLALELEELAQVRVHAQHRVCGRVPQVSLEREPPPLDELQVVHVLLAHLDLRHACSAAQPHDSLTFLRVNATYIHTLSLTHTMTRWGRDGAGLYVSEARDSRFQVALCTLLILSTLDYRIMLTDDRLLGRGRHNAAFWQVLRHELLAKSQEVTEAPPHFQFFGAKLSQRCLERKWISNIVCQLINAVGLKNRKLFTFVCMA